MKIEIPEFTDWKEEAEFWDRTDTTSLMEEEEGDWIGPGRVKPAPGLCGRCGARMEYRSVGAGDSIWLLRRGAGDGRQ